MWYSFLQSRKGHLLLRCAVRNVCLIGHAQKRERERERTDIRQLLKMGLLPPPPPQKNTSR